MLTWGLTLCEIRVIKEFHEHSEKHPRKVRDSSLESLTFIPALLEFQGRSLKRRDNLWKR